MKIRGTQKNTLAVVSTALMLNLAITQTIHAADGAVVSPSNSGAPTVSIKEPANHAAIDAMWVNMHGTFTAKNLKQLTVGNTVSGGMDMPASISGDTFEARNVFLVPGTNTIVAVAEDLAENLGTNTITILGPTDTNTARTFPVKIDVTPDSGFGPLPVTFRVQAHVPGKFSRSFMISTATMSPI